MNKNKKGLAELKEGIKRVEKRKTIISVGKENNSTKEHAHFYISSDLIDKVREFQFKNRKTFPRLSHVVEKSLNEFLESK